MMNKKTWHIVLPIIVIIAVVVVGIALNSKSSNPTISNIVSNVENIAGLKKWSPTGTLVFATENKIYYYSIENDSKETFNTPWSAISNNVSDSGEIIILGSMNQQWNKGKEVKDISDLGLTQDSNPTISPDGSKVAYCSFSNAERDFGYNIMVFENGQSKSIYHSEDQILFTSWADNNTIIFLLKQDGNKIFKYNFSENKAEEITSVAGNIISLSARGDIIALTTDAKSKNLIIVNVTSKKQTTKAITTNYNNISLNPDGKAISYVGENGNVTIYSIQDGNVKSIGKADKIIGWYK